MKNDASSSQYSSQIGPWCVMGAFRGLKVTQKLPKAPQKGPQDGPRATLGSPRGTPRAAKGPQRAPRGSPRATLRGPWERPNRVKVGHRSEKGRFWQKCSATRPCRCAEHFGPPEIARKSTQSGPKSVLEPLERPLRSLLVAQERLGRPRRPTSIDSDAPRWLLRRFPSISMVLGIPESRDPRTPARCCAAGKSSFFHENRGFRSEGLQNSENAVLVPPWRMVRTC